MGGTSAEGPPVIKQKGPLYRRSLLSFNQRIRGLTGTVSRLSLWPDYAPRRAHDPPAIRQGGLQSLDGVGYLGRELAALGSLGDFHQVSIGDRIVHPITRGVPISRSCHITHHPKHPTWIPTRLVAATGQVGVRRGTKPARQRDQSRLGTCALGQSSFDKIRKACNNRSGSHPWGVHLGGASARIKPPRCKADWEPLSKRLPV